MFLCKVVFFVFVSLILDKLGLILFLLPHVFLFLFLFVTNAVIFIIIINVYDKENVHVLLVLWWTCWTCFLSNSCLLFQKVVISQWLSFLFYSQWIWKIALQIFEGVAYISRSFLFLVVDFYHFLFFINIFIHSFIYLFNH